MFLAEESIDPASGAKGPSVSVKPPMKMQGKKEMTHADIKTRRLRTNILAYVSSSLGLWFVLVTAAWLAIRDALWLFNLSAQAFSL